eukprot:34104_1
MATTILPHRACRSKYKPQKIPNSDSMSTQKVVPPLGVKYKANKLPKAIPEAKEEKVYYTSAYEDQNIQFLLLQSYNNAITTIYITSSDDSTHSI